MQFPFSLPATRTRVAHNTPEAYNRRIDLDIERSVEHYADHPEEIEYRLAELDREWDIERALEANAATVALSGVLLGAFVDKRFFVLPGLVGGFLLQHALQGWCPPIPYLRKRGFRTAAEIDRERSALKALRGDFDGLGERQRDAGWGGTAPPSPRDRARRALASTRVGVRS
jgi:hypothetical protein